MGDSRRSGAQGYATENRNDGRTLTDAIVRYPTPTASPYGTSGNGCPGDGRDEYAHKGAPGLETMAKTGQWPTPMATDGIKAPKQFARGNLSLPSAVKLWPTPTARDHRSASTSGIQREGGPLLPEVVGGLLNPLWVEWLMGLPIGWTGSGVSGTALCRWLSHMRSELLRLGSP